MKIQNIINHLQILAPGFLQESYDNSGLIYGNTQWDCTGVLVCLDVNEEVIQEAVEKKCNLIVAHHPIIFSPIKKISNHYSQRCLVKAIKNDIALYAIHTNLDNISNGVNKAWANILNLKNTQILSVKNGLLKKLFVYVPENEIETVQQAIFNAGGGQIENYSCCSFKVLGEGSFKPNNNANPTVGEANKLEKVKEYKLEIIFPAWLQQPILDAMNTAHSYEVVAHEVISLDNNMQDKGAGLVGNLPEPMDETGFLKYVKDKMGLTIIKHTKLNGKSIEKVAICGGSGSFLIQNAISAKADAYITSDLKYHEYFEADNQLFLLDVGHFESEKYTIDLLVDILSQKLPNFAVLKTEVNTNPVKVFVG